MKTVAIYIRVSTQDQNLDLQRNELVEYAQNKGWNVFKIYSDTGSGTKANRQALQALLSDARLNKFDVVMTWKLDRLFRSLRHLVSTLNELQELKIEFISLRDSIDLTTSSGRLLTHLLASFAEFEASIIKERVLAGLKAARVRGIRLGRPQTVNVNDIFILRNQGLSLSAIAKKLGCSKSAVHKTLSKAIGEKSFINVEKINYRFLESSVHQTKDLKTMIDLPKSQVLCHEKDISCHDQDSHVISDTSRFSK